LPAEEEEEEDEDDEEDEREDKEEIELSWRKLRVTRLRAEWNSVDL